jgi:glycosyltransferase involved in cell wall biosynthesis
VAAADLTAPVRTRRRVLVVSGEQIGARMAGPAIRYRNLAEQLARYHDVTLAVPGPEVPQFDGMRVIASDVLSYRSGRQLASGYDVVVSQPRRNDVAWGFHRSSARVVYDLYVPAYIESLAALVSQEGPRAMHQRFYRRTQLEYAGALQLGDAFICAAEPQRDHWLGALGHAGRFTLDAYERDPAGRSLVQVVPFGMPDDDPPAGDAGAIRGTLVPDDAIVLLWTGGIWNWFDPLTVLRAVARAREQDPRIHLVFMGVRHPADSFVEMTMTTRARALAEELGLVGNGVVFHEDWVPYGERHRFLCDADVAVSAHFDNLENRLAFRTRFLDHFWAGLPTITSVGGALSDLIAIEELGIAVGIEDEDAWTAAILRLAGDDALRAQIRERLQRDRDRFRWSGAVRPLLDLVDGLTGDDAGLVRVPAKGRRADAARYASLTLGTKLRVAGPRAVLAAMVRALKRR